MTKTDYIVEDETYNKIKDYYSKITSSNNNNKQLIDHLLNFDYIYKFKELLLNNSMSINDVLTYDFKNIINNIKVSNRYSKTEYNTLITKHFKQEYDELYNKVFQEYKIVKFKDAFYVVFETLCRIYIDISLKNSTYCLDKKLSSLIPFENDVNLELSESLVKRYCKKILLNGDNNKIINLLYQLLKKNNLKYVISYLE
jgi:hypothetical protein